MHKKFDCQGNSSSESASLATPTTSNTQQNTITVDDFIRTSNVTANESEYFFRQNLLLNNKFFLAHTSNFYSSRYGATKPPKPTQLSSSLQRIYENVCAQCSSGGQSQNLSASDGCLRSKCAVCKVLDVEHVATPTENIYEDICEQCSAIFSGGDKFCEKCSLVSSVKLNKPSLLTGLLSTFRGKTNKATGKPPVKPPNKLVIVHNVDTAYKTNKSFDLDEICRLKAKSSSSHIYGKLRKSDDNLLLRRPATHTPQRLIKSAVSESNFSQSQPELNNNISSSATQLYENLDKFVHSSQSPIVAVDDDISASSSRRSSVSSTNNIHYRSQNINNSSVIAWMTSLSKYTVDYAEDYLGVCMVKCIPSNSFASCCGVSGSLSSVVRARIQLSSRKSRSMRNVQRNTVDFERQVAEFKCNLMENNSKRSAIYFKEAKQEFEPIYVVVKDSFLDEEAIAAREAILRSSEETQIEQNEESFLRPKNSHLQRILYDEDVPTKKPITDLLEKPNYKRARKLKVSIRQREHMTDVLISAVGLNKSFIVTFNDKQLYMLLYQLRTASGNQLSKFYSHYNKYLKHLISLYSPSKQVTTKQRQRSRHLPSISCDKHTQVVETPPIIPSKHNIKSKISDFEVQPCDGSHNKREINDFVVKLQRNSPVLRRKFEDFEKTTATEVLTPRQQLIRRQAKMLNDFELRAKQPTVTSNGHERMTNSTKYSHNRRQVNNYDENSRNKSEENIYQPIWKFRTVGFAAEESYADGGELLSDDGLKNGGGDDSDGGCSLYDSIEFYDEDLETPAEWEVAEEFRYSTKFEECQDMVDLEVSGGPPVYDPYQRICVLYSLSEPKRNQLIYDKSQPFYDVESASDLTKEYSYEFMEKNPKCTGKRNSQSEVVVAAASVQAWKLMLRSISYLEDEEDVVSVLCVVVNYTAAANKLCKASC